MQVTSIIRDNQTAASIHRAETVVSGSIFRATMNVSGIYRDAYVATAELDVPELIAPLTDAIILAASTFSWGEVSGAEQYDLQVATDESFENLVVEQTLETTSYEATGLTNAVHYWRVRAKAGETTSEWSDTQTIYVITAPSLSSPAHESFTADTTPAFAWSEVQFATEYDIEIAADINFTNVVESDTVGTNAFTSGGLTNGTYFWRVKAKAGDVATAWSSVRSLSVLEVPVLTSPTNGSTVTDTTPTFVWAENALAESYDIEIAEDEDFLSVIESDTVETNEYTASLLTGGGEFYWRVRTTAGGVTTGWSSVWSVTVQSLTVPVLTSPTDASYTADTTPEFTWGAVSGATAYDILIARDSGFTDIVESASPETNTYTPSALSNDVYYWKVRAKNLAGQTEYSSAWSVTVLTVPALTSPADTSFTSDTTPSFAWDAVEGASAYDIDIATDTGFSNIIQTSSPATNAYTATDISIDGWLYWRVRAKNGAITTAYAAYRSVELFAFINGLLYDNVNDYSYVTDNDVFDFSSGGVNRARSYSLWIKTGTLTSANEGVLCKGIAAKLQYYIIITSSNYVQCIITGAASTANYIGRNTSGAGGLALSSNTIYHIAFIYTGGTTNASVEIWINAVQRDKTNVSSGTFVTAYNSNGNLEFGRALESNSWCYPGLIDEIGYYDHALSSDEIVSLYNGGNGRSGAMLSGIIARWPNNEIISSQIIDPIGGYNMILPASPSTPILYAM